MISKWLTAEYSVPRHEEHLREEGRTEGREEGREEQARYTNSKLRNMGMDLKKRSEVLGLPSAALSEWDKESVDN